MEPFDTLSPADLHRKLRANDVRVPPRTQGRTTSHRETWVTCRFLATIAGTDLLEFPLRVEPGDRPDLVLSLPTGRIGIELTEAISTDQARVDAAVERERSCDFRFIPRYRISDLPRSQAEIGALARGQARTLPRMGDSVERDWVEAMVHIIRRKATTCLKPGFAHHPANWLVVYDNWEPVSALNEQVATERLNRMLSGSDWSNPFRAVFVQRPRTVWEFNGGPTAIERRIPDAWLPRWPNE